MNDNMELKVLKFEKGVTTAGDTWNDSADRKSTRLNSSHS